MTVEHHTSDQVSTTGHQWDDEEGFPLQEYNNPLPKWWVLSFYATIVWAVIYWFLYPAWPIGNGFTKGLLGWSSLQQLQEEVKAAAAEQKPMNDLMAATPLEKIAGDPKLLEFALAGGKTVFGDNCAPCHGSGGVGSVKGFPVLVDDDWLYGGTLAAINHTVNHGRAGVMPGHLDSMGGLFKEAQIKDLTEYVLSLSGGQADKVVAERGNQLFHGEAGCNNCHGDKGKGSVLDSMGGSKIDSNMGAPNLTDKIWLYGGDREMVYQSIAQGRKGEMPAWGDGFAGLGKKLEPLALKKVVLYVHSLGGGK